ncbi:elongation factor Ts [Egibacter rhizosphaerae]|uniref:Elongation factor Ts n=2 Tax=Egibacter rhizosphaerae TaxID=1670831 RepID=A0A411YL43_9ACTN|nr:elongation factor Ts [Egibacter rhizosphaerae]
MMDCKKALTDAEGDFDEAAKLVRERTGAKMADRAGERSAEEGLVHTYLHRPTPGMPPKVGVLLELNCETDFVAKHEGFQELANDVALHIAAMRPVVVSEDDVDEATLEEEREFARKQAIDEGKPEHIVDKIVEGKLQAFYKEKVLLNQPFVRDDSRTIRELLEEFQRTTGEKITVGRFTRFQVGA